MKSLDIAYQRLQNQHLSSTRFKTPADVVKWFGAVQAQDYYGAKWALGLRTRGANDETIERAFASGAILRTHVMRPTWHFVSREDIGWMLKLTAPRVHAAQSYYYRKFELDAAIFKRTNKALTNALRGGKQLTRGTLRTRVQQAGIATDDLLRFGHILLRAELDGVICSGARKGRHFTYALLEERAPNTRDLERDEALAELTRRYFTSHGPATLQDFVWWSGLTASDGKRGLEILQGRIAKEMSDGKTYWQSPVTREKPATPPTHLLPAYDEYLVGYKDRTAAHSAKASQETRIMLNPTILIGGRVAGSWRRTINGTSTMIFLQPFAPLNKVERAAVIDAADLYGAFLGTNVALVSTEKGMRVTHARTSGV